ncbi:Mitochondrial import inner membrane translocase subunit tim8 [Pseudocyphellaria aurata]|nr:Mitochondrial import inner membrane translocase subunit tim8 [Pseudocyphellaria aurata]
MDAQMQMDLSRLSEADQRELGQVVNNELQKGKIQESVHSLTDICFSKCVTGKISSGRLERAEETCVQNCVERFLDGNMAIIKHLESMREGGGV